MYFYLLIWNECEYERKNRWLEVRFWILFEFFVLVKGLDVLVGWGDDSLFFFIKLFSLLFILSFMRYFRGLLCVLKVRLFI